MQAGTVSPTIVSAMPMPSVIYASTSGHTEYVVGVVVSALQAAGIEASVQRAELAKPEDLAGSGLLILASSTWNTGTSEGQLNPHMYALLLERGKDAVLNGRPVACIALGDKRYRYTANAAVYLEEFVKSHGGTLLCDTLKVINEPYGQEVVVNEWSKKLAQKIKGLGTGHWDTPAPSSQPSSRRSSSV